MKQNLKRYIGLLLVIVMVAGMMPASALADTFTSNVIGPLTLEEEEVDFGEPDLNADVETADEIAASVGGISLYGLPYNQRLLAVAETQLGYTESETNFVVKEDEVTGKKAKFGITRYGQWYGLPYEDWCAMFISFCLHYAGVPNYLMPADSGAFTWVNRLQSMGLFRWRSEYTPKPGDLIFFDNDLSGQSDHVGIVSSLFTVDGVDMVETIEGNHSKTVERFSYPLISLEIQGYGVMSDENPDAVAEEKQLVADYASGTDTYRVTMTYTSDALIPDNSVLVVSEILPGTPEYDAYVAESAGALGWEEGSVSDAKVLNISIYADGVEVQPAAPVNVEMVLVDQPAEDWNVVHFGQESAQVLESTAEGDAVSFATDGFSIFVFAKSKLEKTLVASDGNTYNITLTYDDKAGIPDNAELVVTEILQEVSEDPDASSEYDEYLSKAEDALEKNQRVTFARFFDITILVDGQEIQPATPVEVKIELANEELTAEETEDVKAVHFSSEGDVTALDTTRDSQTVTFNADGFSVYGILVTELQTEVVLPGSNDTYIVTVTAPPEANIPNDATLRVVSLEEGTEEYEYARNSVLADKLAKGKSVILDEFRLVALDISILDSDGNEIEPQAPVEVNLKIKSLPDVEDIGEVENTLEIQHHVETNDGVVVETVFEASSEGSFEQKTDETVIKSGTVVNPNSVDEMDFTPSDGESEEDISFITDHFSTYTITWNTRRNVVVHYGYLSGGTSGSFVEFGTDPTPVQNTTSYRRHLIYDFDGYQYYRTYFSNYETTTPTDATRIGPLLRYNYSYNNSNWQYRTYTNSGNGSWQNITNSNNTTRHIYVVYEAKKETTGGTPTPASQETWPEGNNAPQFAKSSTNNGNGTNTIALSIKAAEKEIENSTKANVIVVFDRSGSMSEYLGQRTRLYYAKSAVTSLAQKMLTGEKAGLVKMALVSYSDTATIDQGLTTNYSTYTSKVNSLQADGGTNWEGALALANSIEVDQDAATFIVFVTDGDPTVRMSRGNVTDQQLHSQDDTVYMDVDDGDAYYVRYGIYGSGYGDPYGRNYDYAVNAVSSIKNKNKNLYAIGVSNDVTKVRNLVTEAGISSDHAFLATNSAAIDEAFDSIAESISAYLGFGSISITDGITNLTNAEMKVMQDVDPSSFKYYRFGGENNKYGADEAHKTEWTTREADGCGAASYENGAVKWNMGDSFQLEDGVTYIVEFTVWPKQEAYDLIADLNNGVKVYDEGSDNSITEEERAQIIETVKADGTKTYALKTNTEEVNATYKKTTKSGDVVSTTDTVPTTATYHEGEIENITLESELLTIKKTFEDDLTSGSDRVSEVTLKLKRRITDTGEYVDYEVPVNGSMSSSIVLNENNDWEFKFYVAPGFKSSTNTHINEAGYQFKVSEPNIDYHYDLIDEAINPMLVDGQLEWVGDVDGNKALTAINRVKSGIDIIKHVYDVDGSTEIYPDTEFTITGQLLGPDGQPYTWHEGDSVNASGAYHKYDKDGNRIIYKGHFADSSNISFTLKAGEYIRFINVPEGSTFQFTESTTGMDALGYQWMSTNAVTEHRTGPGEDFVTDGDVQPDVSGQIATLSTGVVGNKQYAITYGNKRTIPLPDVELVKVDATNTAQKLNAAEFKLYSDSELTTPVTVDGNGNAIAIVTGNKEGSAGPDGWYHIGLLPVGTYYMVETTEPAGYVLDETPVIITVTKSTDSYSVTATKDGTSVISGPKDGLYTITVSNDRANKYVKVFKYETGSNPEKALEGAQFTLTGPEGTGINYTGLTTNADGYLVYNNSTLLELPADSNSYTLTETKSPNGYNIMTENVVFTVSADGVTSTGSGYAIETGTEKVDEAEVTVYTIKVQNTAGVVLPETGGIGTDVFAAIGGVMALFAGAVLVLRRKRRANEA